MLQPTSQCHGWLFSNNSRLI